jgi:hypothetical protein
MQKALTDGGVHLHGENGSILPVSLQSSFPSLLGQEENPQISSATSMQKRKTSKKKSKNTNLYCSCRHCPAGERETRWRETSGQEATSRVSTELIPMPPSLRSVGHLCVVTASCMERERGIWEVRCERNKEQRWGCERLGGVPAGERRRCWWPASVSPPGGSVRLRSGRAHRRLHHRLTPAPLCTPPPQETAKDLQLTAA